MDKLHDEASSTGDRALCIRGFGQLAPALVILLPNGADDLATILKNLLEINERLYSGYVDNVPNLELHLLRD